MLSKLQTLYLFERQALEAQLSFDERNALRQQHALPILVETQAWLGVISLRYLMMIDIKEKSAAIKMMNAYLHYVPPATE